MMSYYILTVSQPKVEKEHRVLLVSLDEALDREVFWPWLFKPKNGQQIRKIFQWKHLASKTSAIYLDFGTRT